MKAMKQSKDPFEVAFEEQEDSPPDSPTAFHEIESKTQAAMVTDNQRDVDMNANSHTANPSKATAPTVLAGATRPTSKTKEDDDDDEEENVDVELAKFPSSGDPDKMAKMQAILSQFTEEQMSRYESFRRSGFQKANMKRLLASITGSQKISVPMTIVVSGIAKMFIGELVETGVVCS
ncbi:transcription initiation factor TFIID subunit 11 isoform X2 [Malania oleifera]|uniref:transcription initiation factor TFIID subunit 11 isoform X2 n=1 Tax=Malania oleifera TaxID=397392 RepID=UPI0025ADEA8F|nr:transcription initiation factor TFIID subunit 11 isoform X2 [Malania oleifera]